MVSPAEVATSREPSSDEEVVARVLAGETGMFEIVMRRHNQRRGGPRNHRRERQSSPPPSAGIVVQESFTRALEWKEKKHSISMPFGVIELLRMCLKEFRNTSRTWTTPLRGCSDRRALKL